MLFQLCDFNIFVLYIGLWLLICIALYIYRPCNYHRTDITNEANRLLVGNIFIWRTYEKRTKMDIPIKKNTIIKHQNNFDFW